MTDHSNTNVLPRQNQLQFLRFLAFLLIYSLHINACLPEAIPTWKNAFLAVSFFFLLSGWSAGYTARQEEELSLKRIFLFVKKRVGKYYPLYLVMSVISFLLGEPATFFSAVANLFLVQSWTPLFTSICPAAWFLSVLLFLQILTVPILYGLRKLKDAGIRWQWIFLFLFLCNFLYDHLLRNAFGFYWIYGCPWGRLYEYTMGLLLGRVMGEGLLIRQNAVTPKAESQGLYIFHSILEAALLVGWLLMPYVRIPAWTVYSAGWMLPNVLLLTVFFFGKGALSNLFCQKGFVYAGNLAFFCFLIHQSVIRFVENAFGERLLFAHGAKASDWVTAGAILLVTLLLSAAARVADRRIRKAFS